MPAYTDRQRRFFGAELGRKRAGKKTQTGMSESQLRDFAKKPKRKRHNFSMPRKDKHGYY